MQRKKKLNNNNNFMIISKTSSPVTVSLRLWRAASSSHTSKFGLTSRIKRAAVLCPACPCSHPALLKKGQIISSSMRLVIVHTDRLKAWNTSFFSRHTTSATKFNHFSINFPTNKRFTAASSQWNNRKLARTDNLFSWTCRTNVFYWANSSFFSLESLSARIWLCKL